MNLEQIVTLASSEVRLPFLAMERSLRAVGCKLPLRVIPYNQNKFDLPGNATWWEESELSAFLSKKRAHPMMRKYQCLTLSNYQFVDSDVCFIENPQEALSQERGFVVCCGHWRDIRHACNDHTVGIFSALTTNWQRNLFNAGQFACDTALYSLKSLIETASLPEYRKTSLEWRHNDQPGLNLLVWHSRIPITNLTMPPYVRESSWAGDYNDNSSDFFRSGRQKPYLIHWAGLQADGTRPIDRIFLDYLTLEERHEWLQFVSAREKRRRFNIRNIGRAILGIARQQ